MNEKIFFLINNLANRWMWFDRFIIFCAEYLIWLMVFAVFVMVVRNYRTWRPIAIVSISSAIIARGIVAGIIKYFYVHPRPYWTLVEAHLLLARETQNSFPSGHAIFVFALATSVYIYNKKWGGWYILLACVVGFSRVVAGVHWPYDIVAGAVLGVLTALLCDRIFRKYKYVLGL